MNPVRLQLSRRKGFKLQAASRAINGLDAVKAARPGRLGNPFNWADFAAAGMMPAAAKRKAVKLYRTMIEDRRIPPEWEKRVDAYYRGEPIPSIGEISEAIGRRNAACWCAAADCCHVDLQLGWARRWRGEQ